MCMICYWHDSLQQNYYTLHPCTFKIGVEPIILCFENRLLCAQKSSLLCSKLCFQNQDYDLELAVLLEYISLS